MYLFENKSLTKSLNLFSKADLAITIITNDNTKMTVAQSLLSIIRGCNSIAIMGNKITKILFADYYYNIIKIKLL